MAECSVIGELVTVEINTAEYAEWLSIQAEMDQALSAISAANIRMRLFKEKIRTKYGLTGMPHISAVSV